jgi:hypothetical protein
MAEHDPQLRVIVDDQDCRCPHQARRIAGGCRSAFSRDLRLPFTGSRY